MPGKFNLIDVSGNEAAIDKLIKKVEEAIPVFNNMQRSINDVNNALRNGTPRDYVNSLQEVARLNQELARTNNTLANNERELARAREAQARALREESRARQQAAREAREEARNNQNSVSAYRNLQREMQNVRQRARDYQAQIFNLNRDLREGTISQSEYNRRLSEFSRNASTATREANALQTELRRINQSTTPSAQRGGALSGRVTDIIKGVTVAGAIDKIAGYVVQLGEDAYQTIKILDAQNLALKQIFETEAQISFQKEYLSQITNKYGLELVSTTDAYVKYSAAVKGTYLEGEKARQIFSSFAGGAAKLGLSAKETEGIFKALEQMISKGKIQAEELRGQLGDRMAGAFKLFADGMGVSTAELDKMLKDGKVIADDVLPKVADRLEEVYNLKKAGDIDTLAAAQNRFKNEWTSFLDEMASNKDNVNFLANGIDALSYGVKFLLDILVKDGSAGREVLEGLLGIIGSLFELLGALAGVTNTTSTSMEKFQATLTYISADINILASAFKYLTDIVANFFSTMFQEDGWNKFNQKMEKSADQLIGAAKKYDKITSDADNMFVGYTPDQRRIKAQEDETKKYKAAWDKAKEAKQAYFQFNGKYFSTSTGRNTGKSLDEYIDRGDQLVKKPTVAKSVITDDKKPKKPKKYTGARISGEQKDYLKDLESDKKNLLTILETSYVEGKISEKRYLEESLRINVEYFNKKITYLNGKNAAERKLEADANLEKIKYVKDANNKLFELEYKELEKQYKRNEKNLSQKLEDISNSEYISETERIAQELSTYQESLQNTEDYYNKKIEATGRYTLEAGKLIDLEQEKIDATNDITRKITSTTNKIPEAVKTDLERQQLITDSNRELTFEKQKQAIITNKKLSEEERSYKLSLLEVEANIKNLQIEKERLITRNAVIAGKMATGQPLTQAEQTEYSSNSAAIASIDTQIADVGKNAEKIKLDEFMRGAAPAIDAIKSSLSDLGLDRVSAQFDEMFKKIKEGSFSTADAIKLGIAAIADVSTQIIDETTNKRIAELDKQLEYAKDNSDQEIEFLQGRIDQLNSLEELTAEQEADRRAMEDEQRALREQQAQREKQIEAQKARAEQKAAAQKALINGAAAAAMTLAQMGFVAGAIPAALALAFGVAQSAFIMSKDPVPKYFVGTDYARQGLAWTDERGAEIHTDRHGNIKDFGSSGGARLKYLDEGDKIFTAEKSKTIMTEMFKAPEMQSEDYLRMAMRSIHYPLNIKNEVNIDYDLLSDKIAQKQEAIAKKYTPVNTFEVEGYVYMQEPGKLPRIVDKVRQRNNNTRNARD